MKMSSRAAVRVSIGVSIFVAVSTGLLSAQEPNARPSGTEFGFFTFQTKCMTCHGNPKVERAPAPAAIREMTPERIYDALTNGVMKSQGSAMSDAEIRTLALFMSGKPLGAAQSGDAKTMPNVCPANPPLANPNAGPKWNGWGVDSDELAFSKCQGCRFDRGRRSQAQTEMGLRLTPRAFPHLASPPSPRAACS